MTACFHSETKRRNRNDVELLECVACGHWNDAASGAVWCPPPLPPRAKPKKAAVPKTDGLLAAVELAQAMGDIQASELRINMSKYLTSSYSDGDLCAVANCLTLMVALTPEQRRIARATAEALVKEDK